MKAWGRKNVVTPLPSPRRPPSDMTIAQLVAEAKLIIRELNAVNDQLAEALGVNDHA